MQLALKINVETYRGALQGVPRLVDILRRHQAGATFCFALGPDRVGCRPALSRTAGADSITGRQRYGFKSMLYGRMLPGPDIGKGCADILRSTGSAGFETAILCWDVARWERRIEHADGVWTEIEMRRAHERYVEIFETEASGHAAPGWRMNRHALRLTQRLGYQWASDCRGSHPFLPVWNGELVRCPQLPTTLPTLDELLRSGDATRATVHEALLRHSGPVAKPGQVLTLYAEIEGLLLPDSLELVLTGLREQGYQLGSLGALRASFTLDDLPRHEVGPGKTATGAGPMLLQGDEFLAQWKDAA